MGKADAPNWLFVDFVRELIAGFPTGDIVLIITQSAR